ncbi:MAG: hypothetical protein ABIO45_05485 [Burkholderiaceae bacterium]
MTQRRRPGLAVGLVLVAVACFVSMDTVAKSIGKGVPVLAMLWVRYALQAAAMGTWIALARRAAFRTAHPRFQAMRGVTLLGSSAAAFVALQTLPVAEFTATNMLR